MNKCLYLLDLIKASKIKFKEEKAKLEIVVIWYFDIYIRIYFL